MKIIICCTETKDGVITNVGWKKEDDEFYQIDTKSDLISKINDYKKTKNVVIETNCNRYEMSKSVMVVDDKYLRTSPDKNTKNDLLDLPICGSTPGTWWE